VDSEQEFTAATEVVEATIVHGPICDYCTEGVRRILGWHEIEDPEGLEGTARIPCPRMQPGHDLSDRA
jgi:hypothetical protein